MSTSTLLRPQDLRQIASDAEMKKMDEEDEFAKKKRQQQDELRKAFMDTVSDPAFVAEMERGRRELSPEDGETMQRLLDEVAATPAETLTKLIAYTRRSEPAR